MGGIVILSVVSVIMIVLCAIILSGKGDYLIAGYNTASEKKRAQYDIKRLRIVVVVICLLTTLLACWMPFLAEIILDSKMFNLVVMCIPVLCLMIIFGGLLVINRWCKKK